MKVQSQTNSEQFPELSRILNKKINFLTYRTDGRTDGRTLSSIITAQLLHGTTVRDTVP